MPLLPYPGPRPAYYVLIHKMEPGYLAPDITNDFILGKDYATDDMISLISLRKRYNKILCLCFSFIIRIICQSSLLYFYQYSS